MGCYKPNQIDFSCIERVYGSEPKSVSEVWKERNGWSVVVCMASKTNLVRLINSGVQVFNFLIVDQFGRTHYADYRVTEIIKKDGCKEYA